MKLILFTAVLTLIGYYHDSAAQTPLVQALHSEDVKCLGKGEFATSSDGFIQYHIVEYSPGKCHWEIDREAMEIITKSERKRRDLYFALRTRVLTDKEMQEVVDYGKILNIESGETIREDEEDEKARELVDALMTQFKLRVAAEAAAQKPPPSVILYKYDMPNISCIDDLTGTITCQSIEPLKIEPQKPVAKK